MRRGATPTRRTRTGQRSFQTHRPTFLFVTPEVPGTTAATRRNFVFFCRLLIQPCHPQLT